MSNNNQQEEEEGNFPLRKMKFRVVLTKKMLRRKGKQLVKFPCERSVILCFEDAIAS